MQKVEEKRMIALQASHFGLYNRKNQLIEEMAELTQALTKHNRLLCDETFQEEESCILYNITEEIADVELCLEEIKMLLQIDQKRVNEIKQNKLERTENKLNKRRKENET